MNRRIASGAVLVSAAAIALTGCSSSANTANPTKAPATPTPGPTMSPMTAWAGKLCFAVQSGSTSVPFPDVSDTNNYLKNVPAYLASTAAGLSKSVENLKALPPAPGGIGADRLAAAITGMNAYVTALNTAQTEISSLKPGDAAGLKAVQARLTVVFQQVSKVNPIEEMIKEPTIKTAVYSAAACASVRPATPKPAAPTS